MLKQAAPRRSPAKTPDGERTTPRRSLYSPRFRQEEITELENQPSQDLQAEIDLLRVAMLRMFDYIDADTDLESMATILRSLGLTASRLGKLVRTQSILHGEDTEIATGIHNALRDAMKGWQATR